MQESYREGVANHPGPEPCEGSRKAALEALDRGICRLGIELRKSRFGEPTASDRTEGNNALHDTASVAQPRGVEDPMACRETSCARTGRPRCRPRPKGWRAGRRKRCAISPPFTAAGSRATA